MIAPPKPPHDDLEALIKEAHERQLRRRLLGAAGVAIAAAVGLSIYAFVSGSGVGNVTQPPARGGLATGPPCRASQLTTVAFFQGATQSMLGGVELTNAGGAACELPKARPQVRIVWHGKPIRIRERGTPGTAPPWPPARVLAPGAKAEVLIQWQQNWGSCRRIVTDFRPRLDLRFEGGPAVSVTATGMSAPACSQAGTFLDVSRPLIPQ